MQPQKIFKVGRINKVNQYCEKVVTKMLFKIVLTITIVINSVFARLSENESKHTLMINDENLPVLNRVKRFCNGILCSEYPKDIPFQCILSNGMKRAHDDVGPFWANRGKRNPNYKSEPLYADEPHWVLVRRADDEIVPYKYNFEPFFVTRGKKDKKIEQDSNSVIQEIFAKMRILNHQDSEMKKAE